MIIARNDFWFGSRVTTIRTTNYQCMINTAKEGLFKKQSTMIVALAGSSMRTVGKIIYTPSLRSSDRLQFHDMIAKFLDEDSRSLSTALNAMGTFLRGRGVISEFVNIA